MVLRIKPSAYYIAGKSYTPALVGSVNPGVKRLALFIPYVAENKPNTGRKGTEEAYEAVYYTSVPDWVVSPRVRVLPSGVLGLLKGEQVGGSESDLEHYDWRIG